MIPDRAQGEAEAEVSSAGNRATEDQATEDRTGALFLDSVEIMRRLRGPGGCPWDREQTPESIRKYTLEETYEVLDAIERKDADNLCEELGDLLLQVLFYAQMAAEEGSFSIADVISGLNRKLIRRHPHVFGEAASAKAGNMAQSAPVAGERAAEQVLTNCNLIKQMERKAKASPEKQGRLADVLRSQPALLEAHKLGSTAAKCGFDWPDAGGLLAKIREEADEVEEEVRYGAAPSAELQLEVGDLLFVTANLARHLGVNPEMALRDSNAKFRSRFAAMERAEQRDGGGSLETRSLEQLEVLWQDAKREERLGIAPGSAT